jgi:hypothetical protein
MSISPGSIEKKAAGPRFRPPSRHQEIDIIIFSIKNLGCPGRFHKIFRHPAGAVLILA